MKATTSDGLEIFADKSEYSKDTKILILENNVVILDKIQKLEISSNNITYKKLLEEITSNIKTEIKIDNSHILLGENVIFLRSKSKIYSENPTTIKDKYNNIIKLNGFNYSINDKYLGPNKWNLLIVNQIFINLIMQL